MGCLLLEAAAGFRAVWPQTLLPRLLLLLLAATGPLLGLLLLSAWEDGRVVLENGREQVVQLSLLGAEQQDDVLQEASRLLQVLSRVDDVRAAGDRCSTLLRSILADHPRMDGLAVAGMDGVVSCGTRPGATSLNIADRPYFQEAIRSAAASQPVLSSLTVSRASGLPTLFMALPFQAEGGGPGGVLVASFGLDWFGRLRAKTPGVADQLFQVIDSRDGALLARFPDRSRRVGTLVPEHPLMRAFLASPDGGSLTAQDLDGVRRVFGFAPLPGRDAGLFLAVGLAEAELRAQGDNRFWFAVGLALAALCLTVLTAWLVSQRALLQPIQALAAAATALGRGDLRARAAIGRSAAHELRSLGATFTRMGRRLRDRDVELAGMQARLAASEEHHRLLADASNDVITRFDQEFRRTYVSQACLDVVGYTPEEIIGNPMGSMVHPGDSDRVAAEFTHPLLAGQLTARVSYRTRHKDGRYIWLESSGRRLPDGSGFVVVSRDVSERKTLEARLEEANRQLRILVRQDSMTGLANRRRFDEALGDEYRRAARGGHPLALFMVDVDRFKLFNDTYGHPAGDSCLRMLAGVMGGVLRRSGDLAARYGGEEFAILMAETDLPGALATAERLCTAVRALCIPHAHGVAGFVTVSVGVAVVQPWPDDAGPAALVEMADGALYAAKASGRDQVRLAHGMTLPL